MCIFMTACGVWHQMLHVAPRSARSVLRLQISTFECHTGNYFLIGKKTP